MTHPPRIAFVGRRMSGKTTAAEMLVRSNYYVRRSLAGPVKMAAAEALSALHDMGFPYMGLAEIEQNKAVFRPFLEWLGTTYGRDYLNTPDRWINLFRGNLPEERPVVCDDVRHPNEAKALREMGFMIVSIVRPEKERQAALRERGEPDGLMASEVDIDLIEPDCTLVNDGDIKTFRGDVRWVSEAARRRLKEKAAAALREVIAA